MRKDRSNFTTLEVNKATRARLDKEGDIHSESYDDIINRILDERGHSETNEEIGSMIRHEAAQKRTAVE